MTTTTGLPVAVEWVHIYDYTEESDDDSSPEVEFVVSSSTFFDDACLWSGE